MGYDTGIRRRQANRSKGINMIWGSDGSALGSGVSDWLLQVDNGAGEIKVCRFFSKNSVCVCRVYLDGYAIVEQVRYEPAFLYAAYGSCGEWGGIALQKYDTVNDKYILEVHEGYAGKFGNSCDVGVYNGTGSSFNCGYDVIYGINASVAVFQDRINLGKLETEAADGRKDLKAITAEITKLLDLGPEDVTVVKAGYFDEKTKENVDTLEAFVHPNIDGVKQKVVREFLAQFV